MPMYHGLCISNFVMVISRWTLSTRLLNSLFSQPHYTSHKHPTEPEHIRCRRIDFMLVVLHGNHKWSFDRVSVGLPVPNGIDYDIYYYSLHHKKTARIYETSARGMTHFSIYNLPLLNVANPVFSLLNVRVGIKKFQGNTAENKDSIYNKLNTSLCVISVLYATGFF